MCVEKVLVEKKIENGEDLDSGEKPKVLGRLFMSGGFNRRPRLSVV